MVRRLAGAGPWVVDGLQRTHHGSGPRSAEPVGPSGPVWPDDQRSVNTDGSNEYLFAAVAGLPDSDEATTLAAWVRPLDDATVGPFAGRIGPDATSSHGLSLWVDSSGVVHLALRDAVWIEEIATDDPIPLDAWSHIAGTHDGSKINTGMAIHVDGMSVATSVVSSAGTPNPGTHDTVTIQRRAGSYGTGRVCLVPILSAVADVEALHANLGDAAGDGDLVEQWRVVATDDTTSATGSIAGENGTDLTPQATEPGDLSTDHPGNPS